MSSIPNAVELQRNPGNILITNNIYVYYQFKRYEEFTSKNAVFYTLNLNLHEA